MSIVFQILHSEWRDYQLQRARAWQVMQCTQLARNFKLGLGDSSSSYGPSDWEGGKFRFCPVEATFPCISPATLPNPWQWRLCVQAFFEKLASCRARDRKVGRWNIYFWRQNPLKFTPEHEVTRPSPSMLFICWFHLNLLWFFHLNSIPFEDSSAEDRDECCFWHTKAVIGRQLLER